MRNILFFLFLSVSAFAQKGECRDSTAYELQVGGLFVKSVYTTCEDGSKSSTHSTPGTGLSFSVAAQNEATQRANSWRTDLQYISTIPAKFKEQKRELNAIKAATGVSGLDTIQKALIGELLVPGFKIKETSGISDIVFSQNMSGQGKYKIGTAALKNFNLLPGIIELVDYPATGQNTLFSKLDNGNYVSPGRASVIRKPGSTANKPALNKN